MFFSSGAIYSLLEQTPYRGQELLDSFKIRLEGFKKDMISKFIVNYFHFWNVSSEVLARIGGTSYASNKEKHNEYLWFHPYVAKKRFINLYSTGRYE